VPQNSFFESKLKPKGERLTLKDSVILNLLLMPQNSFLDSKLKPMSEKLTLRDDITLKKFGHPKFGANASKLIF
jgi:hypothetical protein